MPAASTIRFADCWQNLSSVFDSVACFILDLTFFSSSHVIVESVTGSNRRLTFRLVLLKVRFKYPIEVSSGQTGGDWILLDVSWYSLMKSYVLVCGSILAGDARARDTELYTVHVGNLFLRA